MLTQEMQERSNFIQMVNKGNCETVEIGNIYGNCYVVGEKKKEAADWLRKYTTVELLGSIDSTLKKIKECEQLFKVTVGTLY